MAKSTTVQYGVTPIGTLNWCHLFTPDSYQGKSEYKAQLECRVDDPEVIKLMKKYDALAEMGKADAIALVNGDGKLTAAKKETKIATLSDDKFFKGYDLECKEGELTGKVIFRFKMKSSWTGKDGVVHQNKPDVYDSNNKKYTEEVRIFQGATGRIKYGIDKFGAPAIGCGCSAKLYAVLLLSTGGNSGFEDFTTTDSDDVPQGASSDESFDNDKPEPQGGF